MIPTEEAALFVLQLIIIAAAIVLQYFIARTFRYIAAQKGHPEKKWFHWCFWMGLVGIAMVIALPDRGNRQE